MSTPEGIVKAEATKFTRKDRRRDTKVTADGSADVLQRPGGREQEMAVLYAW